jgi:hypothetical protein
VLPGSDNHPTHCDEPSIGVAISVHIPSNLCRPIPTIDLGRSSTMCCAAMPVTAIHKNRHLDGSKDDVSDPSQFRQGTLMDSVPQA